MLSEQESEDIKSLLASFRVISKITAWVVSAEYFAISWWFYASTRYFQEIFADFDTNLPLATRLYFWIEPIVLMVLVVTAIAILIKEFVNVPLAYRIGINMSAGLLGILLCILYWIVMQLPMLKLIQSVS